MPSTAHFKVDPRLATLLGENYRSTELAIKELVDNAYDADAEEVQVTLPQPFTNDPIIVKDNGSGMTEKEVREEYLKVANSRYSRKGERTLKKQRLVKGRKGIGKFAGLMVAESMEVQTIARGKKTTLQITRSKLSRADYDLEKINLPLAVEKSDAPEGTTIILKGINDNLTFPNPDKLKQILIVEYGRSIDFDLTVNDELLGIEDIPGETISETLHLNHAGAVQVKFTITKKPLKQSGLAIRVKDKIVGKPQYFGLNNADNIPKKLLHRVFGEVIADKLEEDVTADWGAIIENSKALQEITDAVRTILEDAFEATYRKEVERAKIRLKKKINRGLDKMPEFRKAFAQKALDKVMLKFFGENEEKIGTVISVLLDTFEKDDYWGVFDKIEKNKIADAPTRTASISDFGAIDKALMAQQAQNRLKIIDEFERLIQDNKTSSAQLQLVLKHNLWLLSSNYATLQTNDILHTVIEDYLNLKYPNTEKPEMIFLKNYRGSYLLIELQAPGKNLSSADLAQSLEHKKDINRYFPNSHLEMYVLGKKLKVGVSQNGMSEKIEFITYSDLIQESRNQLEWQIGEKELVSP